MDKFRRPSSRTRARIAEALFRPEDEYLLMPSGSSSTTMVMAEPAWKYNYNYLAPVAMVDQLPLTQGFELRWLLLVGIRVLQALVNQVAYVRPRELATKAYTQLQQAFELLEHPDDIEQVARGILVLLDAQATLLLLFLDDVLLRSRTDVLKDLYSALFAIGADQRNEKAKNLLTGFSYSVQALVIVATPAFEQPPHSIDDYRRLFALIPLPRIADTFETDECFGFLRVGGPNPVMLRRLDSLDAWPDVAAAITDDVYRAAIGCRGGSDTFAAAIASRRAFVVDYSVFAAAVHGTWPQWAKYIWPTVGFFAVPPPSSSPSAAAPAATAAAATTGSASATAAAPADARDTRQLHPIAIRLAFTAGTSLQPAPRIYTPLDGQRWLMAKTAFQVADGNYHEAVSHLAQTHLVSGAIAIATHNSLASSHPVRRLLTTHFRGTLAINDAARLTLIAPNGTVDALLSSTIDTDRMLAALGHQLVTHNFNHSFLLTNMRERGVLATECDLPNYPYRDCALQIWGAIQQWCTEYINDYYTNDSLVVADNDLQRWLNELRTRARFEDIGELPGPCIATRTYLIELLTMIIFTASAQHAAVNFPQFDHMAFAPAVPLAAYADPLPPPPAPDAVATDESPSWIRMLPPKSQALSQLNVGWLLGSVHYTRLGEYQRDLVDGRPKIAAALERFRQRLVILEERMRLEFPDYPFLRPSLIPHSINV